MIKGNEKVVENYDQNMGDVWDTIKRPAAIRRHGEWQVKESSISSGNSKKKILQT